MCWEREIRKEFSHYGCDCCWNGEKHTVHLCAVVSLCLFGVVFPAHISFGPTNNRLALDKKSMQKVKIIYDSLFSIDTEMDFAVVLCARVIRMERFFCAHTHTHVNQLQLSFLSTFWSIWLINLFIVDAASSHSFCENANLCTRYC